ncbi:MAG TPA: recombinase family protein [Pseudobacteroides sp.]|uniref:recombinase family protein n=1 Tax=Pseudobacteroides sp. TaxID=1968840 RepID=UPI002F94435A
MRKNIKDITPVMPLSTQKKKVAAYARVSNGKDAMLHSLAAQVDYYKTYIRQNLEWEFAGVYADEAITGTKDRRAGFKEMLEHCKNGLIDMIITKSISRFARNTVVMLKTVRELKDIGVDVFFEEQNIHSISGDGELMLTIMASFAQEESLSVSENCKWRIQNDFRKGIPNTLRVYGYDHINRNLVVNQTEAQIVRMIYSDFLNGMGKNAIMRKLISLGVPTKNGGTWSESTIKSILSNEKYTGNMLLQKTYSQNHLTKTKKINDGRLPMYHVAKTHEAIIEQDIYDAVQEEIACRRNIKSDKASKFTEFTGVIHCNKCGANYRRKTTKSGIVWCCSTYSTKGKKYCASKQIPETILKELSAEVLGLTEYDKEVFAAKIEHIKVPENSTVIFVFNDGSEVLRTWENPSRAESWTAEMRETAKRNAIRRSK